MKPGIAKHLLFLADLEKDIKAAIARLDSGTVGVSRDCLWQMTRITSQYAPKGTNATYYARQAFNEVVSRPEFSKFVYQTEVAA